MQFTFEQYRQLLELLLKCGYEFTDYYAWTKVERPIIMRHDVDYDLEKALIMAEIEAEYNIKSTYFLLVSSDLYNVFSTKNQERIHRLQDYGHAIGIHFDEECCGVDKSLEAIREGIIKEAGILAKAVEGSAKVVSMHRPSRAVLEADLEIPDMINSYGRTFLKEFKYCSDSRRHWREPIWDIINSRVYPRLHILTHAFWYFDKEKDLYNTVSEFVNGANSRCYQMFSENFTALEDVMNKKEILR